MTESRSEALLTVCSPRVGGLVYGLDCECACAATDVYDVGNVDGRSGKSPGELERRVHPSGERDVVHSFPCDFFKTVNNVNNVNNGCAARLSLFAVLLAVYGLPSALAPLGLKAPLNRVLRERKGAVTAIPAHPETHNLRVNADIPAVLQHFSQRSHGIRSNAPVFHPRTVVASLPRANQGGPHERHA